MPSLRVHLPIGVLDLDALRAELDAPQSFSAEALAEAERAARAPRLPDLDRTDLPMVTIDPPGSMDLDQAVHIGRTSTGFRVSYAIADVAAFVVPGGALDAEVFARGVTLYAPDTRVPLHPPVLGEDAASLLPDVVRPALLWELDLDGDGALTGSSVQRALVRSRQRLTYEQVQTALADGSADELLLLLREVGLLREQRARERAAVDLPTPSQEVELDEAGRPCLTLRAPLPVEGWNAQISLLTGTAAARLMLDAGIGLLRTLPPADDESVAVLRRSVRALGIEWPKGRSYGAIVSALDPAVPAHAAALTLATRLLRGAGYTAFDGAAPEQSLHSAVAMPYAHCTAPLRRLADRHVGEVCLAVAAGSPVPEWARAALPELPAVMAAATRRASELERAVVDAAEALLLAPRIGERFEAVVVEANASGGVVQLAEPPVRARCEGSDLPLGERIPVEVVTADPARRQVLLRRAAAPARP
jgi:VacB/RNase II family 3'-5' exoribonuclease